MAGKLVTSNKIFGSEPVASVSSRVKMQFNGGLSGPSLKAQVLAGMSALGPLHRLRPMTMRYRSRKTAISERGIWFTNGEMGEGLTKIIRRTVSRLPERSDTVRCQAQLLTGSDEHRRHDPSFGCLLRAAQSVGEVFACPWSAWLLPSAMAEEPRR